MQIIELFIQWIFGWRPAVVGFPNFAPYPTKEDRFSENFMGGKPSIPKQPAVKIPATPTAQIPKPPPPPPPIPPTPTTSNLDASQAATDQRQQAARRNGMRQTLIAGESTGALAPASGSQKKTLLGG